MQRGPAAVRPTPASTGAAVRAAKHGGSPLLPAVRSYFEPRLERDLGDVRVHEDSAAAAAAHGIRARAYTLGRDIVFGAGEYAPASNSGRRLLAHELVHVLQQDPGLHRTAARAPSSLLARLSHARAAQFIPTDRIARTPEEENQDPEQASTTSTGTAAPAPARGATSGTTATPPAAPTVTAGGHTPAPAGMAACPDAPPKELVVVGCATPPSPTLRATEAPVLPVPSPGRFGGDADRATFAAALAQCRAEREVAGEIEARYRADVAAAKQRATGESKADTVEAMKAALEGLDPKVKGAIARAKSQAAADAKRAAAKKIADAQTAVTRQDVATVTKELAKKYEDELAADYDNTIRGALARYGRSWLASMKGTLDRERKRITKEKSAKPRVAKGETPPAKSADQISAEVEAEMVQVRCDQVEWGLQRLAEVSHGWAVGRREQIDFRTTTQSAKYLKNFGPTYAVGAGTLVPIPANLQTGPNMPGVAPEVATFLTQLAADPDTPAFAAGNYSGHGGGSWTGKGFSVDLSLKASQDSRGFWQPATAVRFLLAVNAAATALGARWRVLYNDFVVAQEVNRMTGQRNVEFMGDSGAAMLNWHGPAPLVLHMHLDLEIPQSKPAAPSPATLPTVP